MLTYPVGRWLRAIVLFCMGVLSVSTLWADTLETVERRITSSAAFETTPTLGNNGITDIVVYTLRPILPGGDLDGGDIWYQPLVNGAPSGLPVQVTSTPADDQLNDTWGDYIVYTAYDSVTSTSGTIIVHQISTGVTHTLGTATIIQEPKIHGTRVVWREGGAFAAMVKYYDLNWLPYPEMTPNTIAGPIPPTFDLQIGERFAVWTEIDGNYDVYAYDFDSVGEIRVTNTPEHERVPSTSGSWIVWEKVSPDGATSTIEGVNLSTGDIFELTNGARSRNPSIDGDLVSWESDVNGNLDIWLYRVSTGESFAVTSDADDQYLNDVFGNMVAYVDMSGGSEDVYVSTLEFVSDEPVAIAGPDQSVQVGSLVALDGSESFDPDEDYPLSYQWQLYNFNLGEPDVTDQLAPSAAVPGPTFVANLASDYTAYLQVTDSEGNLSEVDTVTISTINSKPVADAGPDQSINLVGTLVTLDGSQSFDDDGHPLSFAWNLTSKPAGSIAQLDNPFVQTPAFVADVNGEYRATLVVNDGWMDSDPDEVIVSFDNVAPVADAGGNQAVAVGDTVTLSGSGSDANGDPLDFLWSFVSRPDGSTAAIQGVTQPTATFVADTEGTFVVSLVVSDGIVDSEPSNASVLATWSQDQVVELLDSVIDVINGLPVDDFKNRKMVRSMTNKLLAVIKLVESGDYTQARAKLVNDLLSKTDGCAASGMPDHNDWIETCASQGEVQAALLEVLAVLDVLIGS